VRRISLIILDVFYVEGGERWGGGVGDDLSLMIRTLSIVCVLQNHSECIDTVRF
jgi:hypothetical protein